MERSERLHSGDGFLEKNFTFPSTFGVEGKWALVAAFGVQVGVKYLELNVHSNNNNYMGQNFKCILIDKYLVFILLTDLLWFNSTVRSEMILDKVIIVAGRWIKEKYSYFE